MVDIAEICKKVLERLNKIGFEKIDIVSSGQLIFPSKRGDKRISEQELRQLFIEEFKELYAKLYYSIETPTVFRYSFTNELKEIKIGDDSNNGQSALIDMCILKKQDENSYYTRLVNIEFKHKNATEINISKDILKLIHEEENGAFVLLLKNTDTATINSVRKKISSSLYKHQKQWKGAKNKSIVLVILSLEENKNKQDKSFLKYRKVFEKDLETIKDTIGYEWI